jgi:high affinity sulfate transporter 1
MKFAGVEKWVPGLTLFRTYQREWLSHDLIAGVSVAAVALPIGIAYAQLAGFQPVVGIYSCILPAVAYAFFGSSRQLVVNPDSAACMIVAATLLPMAGNDPQHYLDLSIILTFLTGLLCIIGGFLGLGMIANFLSHPILTGYLNGIALSIIANQIGTLLGFKIPSTGFGRTIWQAVERLNETNFTTLILGLLLFILIIFLKRFIPRIPAALVAVVAGIGAVYLLNLQQYGISVVGKVPGGFPVPRIPLVERSEFANLLLGALDIVLISFCSMMTTARGFAARNGYRINANQDMVALGLSDLASGISGGFAVSGADSRTAVANASGGKTQAATITAAAVMTIVLLFLTRPLAFVPSAALAAILISSAIGLFDFASLKRYYAVSKIEFWLSIIATLGVISIGVLPGVLVAVGLAIIVLLRLASRPHDAILGLADEAQGVYTDIAYTKTVTRQIPGVLIYRFDSSLLFFNAGYFKDRVHKLVKEATIKPEWFIFNVETIPMMDITGAETLLELCKELAARDIEFVVAESKGRFQLMAERSGIVEKLGTERFFPSVHIAVNTYRKIRENKPENKPKIQISIDTTGNENALEN